MSSKVRSKSPIGKKKKAVKNTFDIVQFKKMIGKGMVKPWSGATDYKTAPEDIKKIKDKIIEGQVHTLGMIGYTNNGVLYIVSGSDRLAVVNSISYQELKKLGLAVDCCIIQYAKLTKEEIQQIVG